MLQLPLHRRTGRAPGLGRAALLLLLVLITAALPGNVIAASSPSLQFSPAERAWLAAHPVINIRISRDYPPFEFYADGRYQGLAVDYLDQVAAQLGIEFRPVENISWSQSLDEIRQQGKVDAILLITHTMGREDFINFTRDYVSFPWVVFTRNDAPHLGGLGDLDGRMVAIERGFIAGSWLKRDLPAVQLLEVNSSREALEAVMLGHAEAYLGNLAVGSYLIARDGLVDLKVAASTPEAPDALAMGVRKDWPELARLIDRAFAGMSEDEHRAIRQKWLAVRYEHGITRADVFMWVAITVGLALVWVGMLWLKVRRKRVALQQEIALREARERELAVSLREVEAAHRKMRFFIERTPLGYVEWDNAPCISDWNPAAEELLGWRREEVVGHSVLTLGVIPDDGLEDAGKIVAAVVANQETPQSLTIDLLRKDHVRRRCEVHFSTMHDDNGEFAGAMAMFADITDRVLLEEQLVQSEKMLSVGGLAAGLAHEINNPLAGVLQNLQVVQQRLSLDLERNREVAAECAVDLAAVRRYLQAREVPHILAAIGESADRAASIVKNMLNFSRKSLSRPVPSDLRLILNHALELAASDYDLKKKYDFRHIRVVRDYAVDLPLVGCEPTEIQQVFLNLLKNAAQSMAEKVYPVNEKPRLTLRVTCVDGTVRVEIEDNGPGMSEEVRRRVFEPFFTTRGVGSGTGLGLSVSYFIVREHHSGHLEVKSQEGFGTTFIVTLPLVGRDNKEV